MNLNCYWYRFCRHFDWHRDSNWKSIESESGRTCMETIVWSRAMHYWYSWNWQGWRVVHYIVENVCEIILNISGLSTQVDVHPRCWCCRTWLDEFAFHNKISLGKGDVFLSGSLLIEIKLWAFLQDVFLSMLHTTVTITNRNEYIRQAIQYR